MDMRARGVGMEGHDIIVIVAQLGMGQRADGSQHFIRVGACGHREDQRHRRHRWPRPPLESIAPLRRAFGNVVLGGQAFTVAGFNLHVAFAPDILKMGFDMAAAPLAACDLDHHLGRAAHNPRQLGARGLRIGNAVTGIERCKRRASGIMDIAHAEGWTARFP